MNSETEIAPEIKPAAPVEEIEPDHLQAVEFCREAYANVQRELGKVVVGQTGVIEEIMIAIFTRSHALLVGVPGLAKTLMVSTLAQTLQMSFKRIQFTPDLMPSDITGTEVIYSDQTTGEKQFKFLPGPLFANIVLADEINRTPPKTQAAMLEAMQERRVTSGGNTYTLPKPFFVLATQNPLEQEGTYPLPEAQLDRFMFLINVGYPTTEDELQIMRMGTEQAGEIPQPILSIDQILYIQETVKLIPVSEHVYRYAQRIVACTRPKEADALDFCKKYLSFGAGPRASLSLIIAAKAHALIHGQLYVSCANIQAVAFAVMRHRIAVNFTAQSEGITPDEVVRMILEKIPQNQSLG
jgi:MoxR-like ATPase